MQWLFSSPSEKDLWRCAVIESAKLTHAGLGYICQLFDIDPKTVCRGLTELELTEDSAQSRL
jgi:hypothetical protein